MKHKILKDAAALAASSIDKQSAAQIAATLAAAVARRDGHRGLRMVAKLVSQGLAATAEQQNQGTAGPPGNSGRTPGNDSWQKARQLLDDARPKESARTATRGILSGQYDCVNVGAFAFNLYNSSQLQVNQLRASGNVGGQFWIADLPVGAWHRLKDRGDRRLPVWIRKKGIDVEVQVGDGPSTAPELQATDMLHRSTLG
ncbi:hypothetical protein [Kribbella sp. C-35]|uniref:hypothetical protein n=1 Tax=Kribbella sp. C-35 TaxID=2789276 RepID=UPI003979CC95